MNDYLPTRRSGASPLIAQGANVLSGGGGDFRQRRVGNTVVKKKGEFLEGVATGEPTVAIWYSPTDKSINLALIDLEGATTVKSTKFQRLPRLDENGASLHNGRIICIAPNTFIGLFGNANSVSNSLGPDVVTWPAVMRMGAPVNQYVESEGPNAGATVSYIESIQITGLPEYDHNNEPHALGWDGTSYRFGFSCTFPTDTSTHEQKYKTRAPVYYTGNTGNFALTQVGVPFYPGRDHSGFSAYTIGPGRLQALMVVSENTDEPKLPPFFVNSSDYGSTWSSASATFLNEYMYEHPEVVENLPSTPGVRAYYDGVQQINLAKYTLNVYVGNGKNIFIIPNGMYENINDTPKFCAMAFLGTAGSGYVRLNWPPDAWEVGADGASSFPYADLTYFAQDHRNGQLCFGTGCLYISITHEGARKWLITWDFGATWTIRTRPVDPAGITGGVLGNFGTVVKPYVSAEEPGEILFASRKYADGRIDIVKTNGLFQDFKKTGGVIQADSALDPSSPYLYDPTGAFNQYPTYFGRPFPVFPAEFDKP